MPWGASLAGGVSRFALLRGALNESAAMRDALADVSFGDHADSVDGMPAFEYYLSGVERGAAAKTAATAGGPAMARLTDFVNARYAVCRGVCRPCASLVRRYRADERTRHPTHFDFHALVTAVYSLSDAEDYDGGLYVETESAGRNFVALGRGDAVVHESDLFHGVDVSRGERWSWIVWFQDAPRCDADPARWSDGAGDALSLFLHAHRVGNREDRARLLNRSAALGFGRAANALGYAHVVGDGVGVDIRTAEALFAEAIRLGVVGEPHLNLGQLRLDEGDVEAALVEFEVAAAAGNRQAHHNLGIAASRGLGGRPRDPRAAAAHFLTAGLPASLFAASRELARAGDDAAARASLLRAANAGEPRARARLDAEL